MKQLNLYKLLLPFLSLLFFNTHFSALHAQEILSFYPKNTKPSGLVLIRGTGLSNVTSVTIDGKLASYFKVNSDEEVVFAIPSDATSNTFTLGGVNLTSDEPITINSSKLTSLGHIDFTDATGSNESIDLGDNTVYTLTRSSGDGVVDIVKNNSSNVDAYGGSGPNYLHINGNTASVVISNINTEGYDDLQISFGLAPWKNKNSDDVLVIEYKDVANNGAWIPLKLPTVLNNANVWFYATLFAEQKIPQTTNLQVRISSIDPTYRLRLDDFEVSGHLIPPLASFSLPSSISINESIGMKPLKVSLTKAVEKDTKITLIASGTLSEEEFTLTDNVGTNQANTVTILAGTSSGIVNLNIVDDSEIEGTENLEISLESAESPVEIVTPSSIQVTVFDDEGDNILYSLEANQANIQEGNSESITVTAFLTKEAEGDQVVSFNLSDNLTVQREYTFGDNLTLTIPDGEVSGTALFSVVDDNVLDLTDQVTLTASSIDGGAVIGNPVPELNFTVYDNELPKVTLSVNESLVAEESETEVLIEARTEVPVTALQTITFEISGIGIDEGDYEVYASTGDKGITTFTMPEGHSTAMAKIIVQRDKIQEGNEELQIQVVSVSEGIDSTLPESKVITILDEYQENYLIGPETFGTKEHPSIATYYGRGDFDLDNQYLYIGSARIGKVSAGDNFDSYVNFLSDQQDYIQIAGLNTMGHTDLKLGFEIKPTKVNEKGTDFKVEYSIDNGDTYQLLPLEYEHSGELAYETMIINGYLPESTNLILRFTNELDDKKNGWWMDNVGVFHYNPRPEVTLSVDTTWVREVDEKVVTITATLGTALESDEYVFLNDLKGNHVSSTDATLASKVLYFPAGTTEVTTQLKILDDSEEEYGEKIELSALSTSAGLSDRVTPTKVVIDVYDDDKPGPGEYFFKETLNNPFNIEPKPWGDRLPPNYLNRNNRPWSNIESHYLNQHFWNAKDFYITGNANISSVDILGGMSREEHVDWNMGAEKYEGASGGHYFFFTQEGMYVIFDKIRVYRLGTTLRFGMFRFESWSTDGSELKVEYSTDGAKTWVPMSFEPLPFKQDWFSVTLKEDLPYSDNLAVRFRTEGMATSNIVKIDDIELIVRQTSISSLSTDHARRGSEVTIKGENFINVASVNIGNLNLGTSLYEVVDSKTIKMIVPESLQAGGTISVSTAYGTAIGPEFILDDRALMTLNIDKTELEEFTEETAQLTVTLDEPAREDSYVQVVVLGDSKDVWLETDTVFIAQGNTVSEPIKIKAVYDDFNFEPNNEVIFTLGTVIEGHVDLGDNIRQGVKIINSSKVKATIRIIAEDMLYEDTRDKVLVYATVPISFEKPFDIDVNIGGTVESGDYSLNKEAPVITIPAGSLLSDTLIVQVNNDGIEEELDTIKVSSEFADYEELNIPLTEKQFTIFDAKPVVAKSFKILYLNTFDTENDNPSSYKIGTSRIELLPIDREGYIFEGWYEDEAFSTEITEITRGSTGDISLYAKWTVVNSLAIEKLKQSIYPNPTASYFSIDAMVEHIDIFNTSGILIKSFDKQLDRYDISNLKGGLYILSVTVEAQRYRVKLSVNK